MQMSLGDVLLVVRHTLCDSPCVSHRLNICPRYTGMEMVFTRAGNWEVTVQSRISTANAENAVEREVAIRDWQH